MAHVGYVVHYEEDPENPASGFDAGAFIQGQDLQKVQITKDAMELDRPSKTVLVVSVTEIPLWAMINPEQEQFPC